MNQKTFLASTPKSLDEQVEKFQKTHEIKASQIAISATESKLFMMETVWYEEEKTPKLKKAGVLWLHKTFVKVKFNDKADYDTYNLENLKRQNKIEGKSWDGAFEQMGLTVIKNDAKKKPTDPDYYLFEDEEDET